MRVNSRQHHWFFPLFLFPAASLAQEQNAPVHLDRNSVGWFYEAANHHPDTLLLKALQFTAPYPGFYQELSLDSNGNAFTARIAPDWAVQDSRTAILDSVRLDQIRQMLTQLTIASGPALPEPQPGQLRTALAFYNGKYYERHHFIGAPPGRVQEILDIIRTDLEREARVKSEELQRHHKLMKEAYGDWQNKSGVIVRSGSRMHSLRGTRGLLLTLDGHRKTLLEAPPAVVSIYHALIYYPNGAVTGSGSGGSPSDDPLSTEIVIWTVPRASGKYAAETDERVLEIKYQAIDDTVSVGGKTYQLAHGNMFVIHMKEDWTPVVSQIEAHLDEQTTEQRVLDSFKSIFRDNAYIQRLELN